MMLMPVERKNELQELYPFESHFLDIDGISYHYLDEGPRDAEVLLCLHGNPTWSFYYRELIKYFSKRYRVIVPDHIGCGLSEKPQVYSYRLNDHIDNVLYLIHSLGLKQVNLIVHDWGGAIGMGVATMAPSLVKRVVLMNTAAFISKHIPWRIAACRLPLIGEWMVRKLNAFAYPATFMASEKKLSDDVKKAYLFPYQNYRDRVAIARFVQDIPMEKDHPTYTTMQSIESRLKDLDVPIALIWGAKDFCFTAKNFLSKWKEIYPNAEVHCFEDAGHYVLEDKAPQVLTIIEKFLESEQ
jgi:pimeloyl-ACP methyl ester carboxylesterase